MRAAGAGAPAVTADDPLAQLSLQELQVVRLAAAGASNKQIGAQLFLSPRTVGFHLYRAFPKLGVTTREELARYAPRPNRPPERPGGSGHRGRSARRTGS